MKAILLNSGGIDSRLTGFYLKKLGYELTSLYLDIGHGNVERAKVAAKHTADMLSIPHYEGKLDIPVTLMVPNPAGFNSIPFMTAWLFLTGAVIARSLGCDYFASGVKKGLDTENVWNKVQELINLTRVAKPVMLIHPLSEFTTYNEAIALTGKIELADTVSCNDKEPCRECSKCKERLEMKLPYG